MKIFCTSIVTSLFCLMMIFQASAQSPEICKLITNKKSQQARQLIWNLTQKQISEIKCFNGAKLLQTAVAMNDIENVKLLLEKSEQESIMIAFHTATQAKNHDMSKLLVKKMNPGGIKSLEHFLYRQIKSLCTVYDADRFFAALKPGQLATLNTLLSQEKFDQQCLTKLLQNKKLWKMIVTDIPGGLAKFFSSSMDPSLLELILKYHSKELDLNKTISFILTILPYRNLDSLKILLTYGYSPAETDMLMAVQRGELEILKTVLEHPGEQLEKLKYLVYSDNRILITALEYKRDKILKYLKSKGLSSTVGDEGLLRKQVEISRARRTKGYYALLSKAKKNIKSSSKQTFSNHYAILFNATTKGNLELIKNIFDNPQAFSATSIDPLELLEAAITYNQEEVFDYLMTKSQSNWNQPNQKSKRTLLESAALQNNTKFINKLLKAGILLDRPDRCSILQKLIAQPFMNSTLELLLKKGASINHIGKELSPAGEKYCQSPFEMALQSNNTVAMQLFLKHTKINLNTKTDRSYLHQAITNGHYTMAAILKKKGARLLKKETSAAYRNVLGIDYQKVVDEL